MAADLDAHRQVAQEVLLGELDFKLPNTSSFVLDRRTVSFQTNSASSFRPDGVRNWSVTLTGDNIWLDTSTLTISYTVKNVSPVPDGQPQNRRYLLQPKTVGAWNVMSRLRTYLSGMQVDNQDAQNRLQEMMWRLLPRSQKIADASMGYLTSVNGDNYVPGFIANQDTYTVAFRPVSGLLNCGKMLPICFCPLRIEGELAPGLEAWWSFTNGDVTYHTNYEIADIRVNCDVVVLDSNLHEAFAKQMNMGRTLPLNITSYAHFNQALLGTSPVVSLTRAASHIRDIGWSFTRVRDVDYNNVLSIANDFVHPHLGLPVDGGRQLSNFVPYETAWYLGAKRLGPENNYRSNFEYYHSTLKALGLHAGGAEAPDLDLVRFTSDTHTNFCSLEKVINVAMTGLSSRSGSLLSVQFQNLTRPAFEGAPAAPVADQVWILMLFEQALEMSKFGVIVSS